MDDTTANVVPDRLNGVIRVLESGKPAFIQIAPPGPRSGQTVSGTAYDGVMFEMEHNPFDMGDLRLTLQAMLSRRQIAEAGSIAPPVTPMVRISPNGREMNQWVAKQALDSGVYGLICPHVDTVDGARNAVAMSRYARPEGSPHYEPAGLRGDAPGFAARYWGLTQQEYYQRADVWPLVPHGELMVIIQCESVLGIKNLPRILEEVKVSAVLIGEGDLSQNLGYPRQYEHPTVLSAMRDILDICKANNVTCGHPHVTTKNVERLVEEGYRLLATAPVPTYAAMDMGRQAAGAR